MIGIGSGGGVHFSIIVVNEGHKGTVLPITSESGP